MVESFINVESDGCLTPVSYNPIRLSDTSKSLAIWARDKPVLIREFCKRLSNPSIIMFPFYNIRYEKINMWE